MRSTPAEQATVMAKRKKRAVTRRGMAKRKPAKSMRGKPGKRKVAKAKSKKRTTKTKRAVAKTIVPKGETVVVDIVEEPVPGVMVVTELEATEIHGPSVSQDTEDGSD